MIITLYSTGSEKNKIHKTLSSGLALTGTLREESSVIAPSILINVENPTSYNYAHIPDFGRYYYISDMVSVRNGLWRLYLKSDPLMSFANEIMAVPVILSNTENVGQESYLSGPVWKSLVKEKTDIIPFSSGLSQDGHFILITAGGGS